jgi:hypothetical protein
MFVEQKSKIYVLSAGGQSLNSASDTDIEEKNYNRMKYRKTGLF